MSGWPARRTRCRTPARPASVRANTLAGRPRPRAPYTRCSRASTCPLVSSTSRCRRIPAGVSPSRSASAAAVDGPCSRMELATRCRVEASASPHAAREDPPRLWGFHNTSVPLFEGAIQIRGALQLARPYSPTADAVLFLIDACVRLQWRARQAGNPTKKEHPMTRYAALTYTADVDWSAPEQAAEMVEYGVRQRPRRRHPRRRRAVSDQYRHHRPGHGARGGDVVTTTVPTRRPRKPSPGSI